MNILLIQGATRPNNLTQRAVKFVAKYIKEKYPDVLLNVVKPDDFNIEYDDHNEQDKGYVDMVNNATAFIIISPEYNHGYPGKLKSLLDSTYSGYNYKHVLIGGVSDGSFGGARMVENLAVVLKCLRMYMNKEDLLFPKIQELLDEEGNSLNNESSARSTKIIDEFISRAKS